MKKTNKTDDTVSALAFQHPPTVSIEFSVVDRNLTIWRGDYHAPGKLLVNPGRPLRLVAKGMKCKKVKLPKALVRKFVRLNNERSALEAKITFECEEVIKKFMPPL
jgi:hypothetical protein